MSSEMSQMSGMNTMTKMSGGRRSTRKMGKMPAVGSKAQVWHHTAHHTSGGLTRKDLMKHKGYKAKKGTFKLFRK
jgi:DVNP family